MEGDTVPERESLVLLRPDLVPERWQGRSVLVALVPLMPVEAEQLLSGGVVVPDLSEEEERLLALVAAGESLTAMAEEFRLSRRGVQHRLARLRDHLSVGSNAQLATLAAARGVPTVRTRNRHATGVSSSPDEEDEETGRPRKE